MPSGMRRGGLGVRVMTVLASLQDWATWQEWIRPLGNTLGLMFGAGFISLLGGVPAGIALHRLGETRDSGSHALASLVRTGLVMAMALPLILHAAAWEAAAGKFGWFVQISTGGNLSWVTWIHGVHGIAIVALATERGLLSVPLALRDSIAMEARAWQRFWLRLTLAFPWIGIGLSLVLLLAATEMTVVNLHSVRTVADHFYLLHAVTPDQASVTAVLGMPLVLAVLIAMLWRRIQQQSVPVDADPMMANEARHVGIRRNAVGRERSLAFLACLLAFMLCLAVPILGLILQAGHSVDVVDGSRVATWSWRSLFTSLTEAPVTFRREYLWTAIIAACIAGMSLPSAWAFARVARWRPRSQTTLDAIALFLFAIPGPIIGLTVVRLFTLPVPGFESLATQTVIPTCLAAGLRGTVIAYGVLRASYAGISDQLIDSARMDGGLWWQVRAIELPLLRWKLILAGVCAGVVGVGDVPAMLPVLPPSVVTVSTRLFSLLHSGARYQEAALAFWFLVALLLLAVLLRRLQMRPSR